MQNTDTDKAIKDAVRNNRIILGAIGIVLLVVIIFIFGRSSGSTTFSFNSNPTVESLQKIGQLAGLKVFIGDVLTVESTDGSGTFSGSKGAWIIKGDALLATDMKKSEVTVNEETKTVLITLQEPQVLSPRIDHNKTIQYSLESGLFTRSAETAKLHQSAMQQAQLSIEAAASLHEYREVAKNNIESLIKTIIELSYDGWKAEFKWKNLNSGEKTS